MQRKTLTGATLCMTRTGTVCAMFQSSPARESGRNSTSRVAPGAMVTVSILAHSRERAQLPRYGKAISLLPVSILAHSRERAQLAEVGNNQKKLAVSILAHSRERAQRAAREFRVHDRLGFNPRPLERAGATVGDVAVSVHVVVSILAHSRERAQRST